MKNKIIKLKNKIEQKHNIDISAKSRKLELVALRGAFSNFFLMIFSEKVTDKDMAEVLGMDRASLNNYKNYEIDKNLDNPFSNSYKKWMGVVVDTYVSDISNEDRKQIVDKYKSICEKNEDVQDVKIGEMTDSDFYDMKRQANRHPNSPFANFMLHSTGYQFIRSGGEYLDKWEAFAICQDAPLIIEGNVRGIYARKKKI